MDTTRNASSVERGSSKVKRIAWSRLTALALGGVIVGRAMWRGGDQFTIDQVAIAIEVAAAALMASHRTRAAGVVIGAGVLCLEAMSAMLDAAFDRALWPAIIAMALLSLGKRLDDDRHRIRPSHVGTGGAR
jgi:hypothetical protein